MYSVFLTIINLYFYNLTKLLGQNIHVSNKNHTLFLFHHFCLAFTSTCLISSYPVLANFDKFWKGNLQDPAFMPKERAWCIPFSTLLIVASAFTSGSYNEHPHQCVIHL